MHKLLQIQLKRCKAGLDKPPADWSTFLATIEDAYRQADEDRLLMERSLELTSQELLERNTQLRHEVARRAEQERTQRLRADRLHIQNEAMSELARNKHLAAGNLPGAVRAMVELGARYLDVARVSVWLFDDDRSHIRCLDLYELADGSHSEGYRLEATDYPAYFLALESNRTITAHDARSHPATREFASSYLVPLGITSMLDSAICRGLTTAGVVCCEHVGEPRRWSPEEELFVASLADITALAMEVAERRRAEEEVEHSLSLLRATLESTADGILVVDGGGKIVSFNRRFVEMWRIPDDVLSFRDDGRALAFVLEQLAEPDAFIAKVRELYDKPDEESEDVLVFRDGRVFERVSRPQMLGGVSVGRVWSFHDVTENRRAQDELLRAKRLEAAGQLAGQIAHDFNNLLTPLVAYPDLMRRMFPVNEKSDRLLREMESAAMQIVEINQQLLTLGRRGHFHVDVFDPNALIEATVHTLDIPDGILVNRQLAPDLKPVSGSSAQIMRVLTNLIANAVDAMNGFGTLTVTTSNSLLKEPLRRYARVNAGEYVCLTIADSGPGIPTEIQEKIFEPFFTTKNADKKRGSGLGLSVVHSVLEDHKGYIDLESSPGQGAQFSLYLPVDNNVRTASTALQQDDVQGNGAKVLVVDDDPLQRNAVTMILETLGYATIALTSGEQAVAHMRSNECDLVILDMKMDGIDGTETLRQIKILRPEQRAIILSGYSHSDRVEEAIRLGASSFVSKLVTTDTLARAVKDALNRTPGQSKLIIENHA